SRNVGEDASREDFLGFRLRLHLTELRADVFGCHHCQDSGDHGTQCSPLPTLEVSAVMPRDVLPGLSACMRALSSLPLCESQLKAVSRVRLVPHVPAVPAYAVCLSCGSPPRRPTGLPQWRYRGCAAGRGSAPPAV